jgi:hypothetical protein
VWLTPEEEKGYYYGAANEALWPLCHLAHARPIFRRTDWEHYRKVNARFADAVVAEAGRPDPVVLVQDYHQLHCNNFLDTADRSLELRVDPDHHSIVLANRETTVWLDPMSTECRAAG